MGKEIIKSEELKDLISVSTDIWDFADVSDEDLDTIRRLDIPGRKLSGALTDIDLFELSALRNLEDLTIKDFEINDAINDVFESLPNLKSLKFGNCDFGECTTLKTVKPLKSFTIYGGKNIDKVSRLPQTQYAVFEGVEVPFGIIDFDSLKKASFTSCRVIDAFDITEKKDVEEIEFVDSLVYGKKEDDGKRKKIEHLRASEGTYIGMEFEGGHDLER